MNKLLIALLLLGSAHANAAELSDWFYTTNEWIEGTVHVVGTDGFQDDRLAFFICNPVGFEGFIELRFFLGSVESADYYYKPTGTLRVRIDDYGVQEFPNFFVSDESESEHGQTEFSWILPGNDEIFTRLRRGETLVVQYEVERSLAGSVWDTYTNTVFTSLAGFTDAYNQLPEECR